jgi:uncharacterized membrane protein
MAPVHAAESSKSTIGALWLLIAVYAFARILQIYPHGTPMSAVVVLHVLPPFLFALIHGAKVYGARGIAVFVGICVVVGNFFETLSIRTGFPFGHYYFTGVMGPKVLAVPVLLGFAYVGMGYVSWILANVIVNGGQSSMEGSRMLVLPLVASFAMVSWDLALDPIWGTVLRAWVWLQGGAYFGVPLSNFLGWFLTVYILYQAFALHVRGRTNTRVNAARSMSGSYWRLAVLFYGVSAAGNLLLVIPRPNPVVVADPAGTLWRVGDITATCALVTVFTMGAFAVFAWARLSERTG